MQNGHAVFVDGNKEAREKLRLAGVNVFDRLLTRQGLGHNKFLVVVDNRTNSPISAWTGSTNWSPTGLCTQLNNAVLIDNPSIADIFYKQWLRLKASGNETPKSLIDSNSNSPTTHGNFDIWFTPVRKPYPGSDIIRLKELIDNAKNSILYVMFQPGLEPLKSIVDRRNEPEMYIRGVVSNVISSNKEQFELSGSGNPYTVDLKQPEGVLKNFRWWLKEITKRDFIGIGHAITHTKMIVIDPFTDHCKVITGSHNFSKAASTDNDENFIVIKNNRKLAEHYAVACLAIYNHYRWRAYLKEKFQSGQNIWSHLSADPAWQTSYLSNNRLIRHLDLWCPKNDD